MQFTEEQIKRLAPDEASAAAGKQLAAPAKWLVRRRHETALWGDCQGSGKTPYSTLIDLRDLAFKCSCPSRKFPCKHGLGLLFLYARAPETFTLETDLAPHIAEWMGKRDARQSARADQEPKPVDEKARQKRADQRFQKIDAGVEELSAWLKDRVRTGLLDTPQQAYEFTQKIGARMIDAQAPGLAARLRAMSETDFHSDTWQRTLLREFASAYMLLSAYRSRAALSAEWQSEIHTLLGIPVSKEEVLQQGQTTRDLWAVCAVEQTNEEKLRVEKVWLYGKKTARFALLLHFYGPGQTPERLYTPATTIDAELVYYPAIWPLRALEKERYGTSSFFVPTGFQSLDEAADYTSQALAAQPFQSAVPLWLSEVAMRPDGERWQLADAGGRGLPLRVSPTQGWRLLAATLGRPFTCMGLWEDGAFEILGRPANIPGFL